MENIITSQAQNEELFSSKIICHNLITEKKLILRPITPLDRDRIKLILEETKVFMPQEVKIAVEMIDETLACDCEEDYLFTVLSCQGEEALGYACYGATPLTNGTFDLYWIAVHPRIKNKGYGTLILKAAEMDARTRGGRMMIVDTSGQPHYEGTRAFYLRNSYIEAARIENYYSIGDPLIIYQKLL